jgi:hypothetical protein
VAKKEGVSRDQFEHDAAACRSIAIAIVPAGFKLFSVEGDPEQEWARLQNVPMDYRTNSPRKFATGSILPRRLAAHGTPKSREPGFCSLRLLNVAPSMQNFTTPPQLFANIGRCGYIALKGTEGIAEATVRGRNGSGSRTKEKASNKY